MSLHVSGDAVEWFEDEGHVFDGCSMTESDIAALQKLKGKYDLLPRLEREQMRGMLHLVEDGWTNEYLPESAEILMRIHDLFQAETRESITYVMTLEDGSTQDVGDLEEFVQRLSAMGEAASKVKTIVRKEN